MARSRKRSIWIAAETGGFGVDPDADGSDYLSVPAFDLSDLTDQKEQLPTNYFTGRLHDTAPIPGADSAEISFGVPLIGLATAAGDGIAPPTADWLDTFLTHIFGAVATHSGEGSDAGGHSASTFVSAAVVTGLDDNDLIPVYDAATLARTQWARITSDTSEPTYSITPAWASTPSNAAIAYGTRLFQFTDGGGNTLSVVYQDDDVGTYRLAGGRITSASISGDAGQSPRLNVTMRFNSITEEASTKTSLPSTVGGPAITPTIMEVSPVWFNGSQIATSSMTLDFGVEAARIPATSGAQGRAGDEVIRLNPTLAIQPLRTEAQRILRRNVTEGEVLVQIGAGVLSGGVLNTLAVNFGAAYAAETTMADQDGVARQSITFQSIDPGAGGVHFQVARA